MGIIKAVGTAIGGGLADQWLEVIEPYNMGAQTVLTKGVLIRRGQNTKGTVDTISNGSVIHVAPNQFMMILDGGKVVDYTAEAGYYKVTNSSMPSLFNGELGEALAETFKRIAFGGQTPTAQKVYFINLQEIKGIKFGTRNPINYFDQFYNAELFLRAYGTYSVKITDPLKFYSEVLPRNKDQVEIDEINEQYLSEFLEAFQTSINQMSADGIRVSFVSSKGRELSKYMSETLDEEWKSTRGMEIQSVGIASITYDEESSKLINMRNRGAMLGDPVVREGYVQGSVARGMEAAGSNPNGAMAGFMGMGMGMGSTSSFVSSSSSTNMEHMKMNQNMGEEVKRQVEEALKMAGMMPGNTSARGNTQTRAGVVQGNGFNVKVQNRIDWTCRKCGAVNHGKFCSECGAPKPAAGPWTCSCGAVNTGKFCSECGKPRE